MILTFLFYLLPIFLIGIASYLYCFKNELKIWLKLDNLQMLSIFSICFFMMGITGIILNLLRQQTLLIIWMIVAILLTALLAFTFAKRMG